MRIALSQQSATPDRGKNLAAALTNMRAANTRGADVIVFPELALERFFPQHERFATAQQIAEPVDGETCDAISREAKALGLVTVFNFYEAGGHGDFYDSSPVFDADGSLLGVTRMVHITDYVCFHEKAYYTPGNKGAPVYNTRAGKIGVAICYDRHYPEYMRALGVGGAELVVIPQAGADGEWPEGVYEAEVKTAAFQNGYFAALCNRVGVEEKLTFSGESFVVDPEGRVLVRGARLADDLIVTDIDVSLVKHSTARRLFWRDRRPELYGEWLAG